MSQISMRIDTDVYLGSKSQIETRRLLDIARDYGKGDIEKPPHQREEVWLDEQKMGWIKRLDSHTPPVGVIVTYQIRAMPKTIYLNDGWQRISTTLELLRTPEKYGYSEKDAELLVRACHMPVQHMEYNNHEEALRDFQFLNIGTKLTPYEFYRGITTYLDNYKTYWDNFFDRLHSLVLPIGRSLLTPDSINRIESSTRREHRHKGYRDDYALLHRYLTKQAAPADYDDVGQSTPSLEQLKNKSVIECKLRDVLEEVGYESSGKALDDLKNKISRETRLLDNLIPSALEDNNAAITITAYRFILHVSIWRSFNNIPQQQWEDFLTKLLIHGGGGSVIVNPKNPRDRTTIQSARIGAKLKRICGIIGSDMYLGRPTRINTSTIKAKEGCDQSHLLPFSKFGNGKTFPEPAGRNRSRGAHPVEPIEDYDDPEESDEDEEE